MEPLTYTYEEVYAATLAYFNGDTLPTGVFVDKYALRDREGRYYELTPDDMHRRLAYEFARIEAKYPKGLTFEEIYGYLKDFNYIVPQGSPMFGIGNNFQLVSTSNCAVIDPPQDTMSSIFDSARDMANLYKRRFGVGIDISYLRPEGASVNNAAVTSTGAWSFADFFSFVTEMVGQSGRRGALMITLDVRHPDIEQFIQMKKNLTKVTGANVSVKVSDDFMQAVERDEQYTLHFPVGAPIGERLFEETVRARDIFNLIAETANASAEPGFLFWDTITRNLPLEGYPGFKTVSTNPCGEIPLCGNDSCRLISLYLPAFVVNEFEEETAMEEYDELEGARFDFRRFFEVARIGQRLSDDLVELELEKLHQIREEADTDDEKFLFTKFIEACENGRRTGLGTHALADALSGLRVRYDSDKGLRMAGKIYQTLKFAAYFESVNLAKQRGAFPIWDWELEKDCEFFKRFEGEILSVPGMTMVGYSLMDEMRRYGRRNGALLTNAPTGSVSIVSNRTRPNGSSGIEPVFMLEYNRKRKVDERTYKGSNPLTEDGQGGWWETYTVYHGAAQAYRDKFGLTADEPLPDFFVTSAEIDPSMRVRMQATIQKHIDHSLSSTLNLPEETEWQTVADIYMEAWKSGCKGMTVYRAGSRQGVLTATTDKEELSDEVHERLAAAETEAESLRYQVGDLEQRIVELQEYIRHADYTSAAVAERSRHTHRGRETNGVMVKATFRTRDGDARKVYIFVGMNEHGEIVETFVIDEQGDEELKSYAAAVGKLASRLLKFGVPVEEIVDALEGLTGASVAYEGSVIYNSVPDMLAKVIRQTQKRAALDKQVKDMQASYGLYPSKDVVLLENDVRAVVLDTGMVEKPQVVVASRIDASQVQTVGVDATASSPAGEKCPRCKERAVYRQAGCPTCTSCGWAKCS